MERLIDDYSITVKFILDELIVPKCTSLRTFFLSQNARNWKTTRKRGTIHIIHFLHADVTKGII